MENQIVKTEKFFDEPVRFNQKDGIWMIPLVDIARTLKVDRSNLTKIIENDEIFDGMTGMVQNTTLSGTQTMKAITKEGLIALLVKMRASKSRSREQIEKIKQFQKWAIDTLGKVIDGKIDEINDPYGMHQNPQYKKPTVGEIILEQLQIADAMAKYANVDRGIATAMAIAKVEFDTGADLTMWKNILPKSQISKSIGLLTVTEIGKELGFGNNNGHTINRILNKEGYLEKIHDHWVLTQKGNIYAEAYPVCGISESGKSYSRYQIKWQPKIIDILRDRLFKEHPSPEKGLLTGYI